MNDNAQSTREGLEQSLAGVIRWVRAHDYKAYEPADGNSSILFPLTFGKVWPMRILQQVVLRAPFNIRPLLGVAKHESAIGRGYMAWGYLTICKTRPSPELLQEARACLDWLIAHRASGHAEFAWGDPYNYATRSGRRPLGAPILIWTALIGQVFLDAYEITGDARYLQVAESVARWISALPAERTSSGWCLSYNAYKQESIHNSNAMGAAFLARIGVTVGNDSLTELARQAMSYTCARQLPDGGWYYGEEPKYQWLDNFHTGYNLSALKVYRDALQDSSFDAMLWKGLAHFKQHFFDEQSRPKYFANSLYPIDIQCAAQAIETLVSLSDVDPGALQLAVKVARWTIDNMQADDGHFIYRHLPRTCVTTPMLHWGQGTMTKALSVLITTMLAELASEAAERRFRPSHNLPWSLTRVYGA